MLTGWDWNVFNSIHKINGVREFGVHFLVGQYFSGEECEGNVFLFMYAFIPFLR